MLERTERCLEAVDAVLWLAGVGILILELVFGAARIRHVVGAVAAQAGVRGARLRRAWLGSTEPTPDSPGPSWWESGAVAFVFFWLSLGPANFCRAADLYRAVFGPSDDASYVLSIWGLTVWVPWIFSAFGMGAMLTMWCASFVFLLGIFLIGGWKATSCRGYFRWCRKTLRAHNSSADRIFNGVEAFAETKRPTWKDIANLPMSEYVFGIPGLILIVWAVWPALLYLLMVSVSVWILGALLSLFECLFSISEKLHQQLHVRFPLVAIIIGLLAVAIDLCLGKTPLHTFLGRAK